MQPPLRLSIDNSAIDSLDGRHNLLPLDIGSRRTRDIGECRDTTVAVMAHRHDDQAAQSTNASQLGSSTVGANDIHRTDSTMSQSHTLTPSRGGTLKKRQTLSRKNSIKRSGSRKESRPGSVRSLTYADELGGGHTSEMQSAFFTPVPTSGSPTEILANRFQGKINVRVLRPIRVG